MKTFFVDFVKFGAFFTAWTFVFSLFGLGAFLLLGADRVKGIFVRS